MPVNAKVFTVRLPATLIVFAAVTGCATFDESASEPGIRINATENQSVSTEISRSTSLSHPHVALDSIQTNAAACSSQLFGSDRSAHDELNSGDIRMVNWNIKKGGDPQWTTDLATFQSDPDLMIFQEASLNSNAWGVVTADQYHSFSPGYRTRQSSTGVMTVSTAKPLTQCNFVSVEPWIRTPKATVITEYGLTDTDQTLLVVNIHAVSFTFGTYVFQEQLRHAESVLHDHVGPILLSGDFNTWRGRRSKILHDMAEILGLETLDYDADHRRKLFGQPLDHIYVRGLKVLEATTHEVDSSDHNAMSARLSL